MPFGGLLSLAGAGISGISALSGLLGGSPASNVQGYNYANRSGADAGAYGGIGNLSQYNVAGNLLPQYQQIAQQGVNSPYAQGYQQNANQIGQAGVQGGLGLLPDAQALISMGFDPQQALYSKLQNQNQQQNSAILGQSGVASTPYGAGVAADANTNFNINWQNQQLQRAIQGGQAGGALQNTGLQTATAGAGLPYNTMQGITGNQLNLLGQTGSFGQQAAQIPQQQIQDYLQYLSGGQSQQQTNLNQANSAFQQNQALGGQLGQALAGMGKGWGQAFGGGGGSGSPMSWSGTGYGAGTGGMSFPMFT